MSRINEIRERLTALQAEIVELAEVEDFTDEQATRADEASSEWESLTAELEPLEARAAQLDAIRTAKLNPANVESGDGAARAAVPASRVENPYDLSDIGDRRSDKAKNELRARAEKAIESFPRSLDNAKTVSREDMQENALRLAESDPAIAEHILRTGNPAYVSAFKKLVGNPTTGHILLDNEERAALAELGTTTGGYLVPPFLDPSIILTNTGINNPFRQISTVKTIATQTWKGVTSAGVTSEWTAEATEAADASPTFGQPTITPGRADAYVQASFEMIEDTDITGDLAMLFADSRDRLEGAAFATGDGSNKPYGIVTELQAVTNSIVQSNTNGAYGAVDVFALDNSLGPRFRENASWLANKSVYNATRQFASGSGPQFAFWVDFGGGKPASLIGYPTYLSSSMHSSTLGTATISNDDILVLGDFSQYYIVDRIGMSVAYNPLVVGGTGRRPTGEVGWFAFWRVGGRTVNADAFRLLRV